MRAAIAPMQAAGGGSVVNVSSAAGARGYDFMFAYGVSKWAIRRISRYAAQQLAGRGIRVNVVLPGVTDTPMQAGNSAETIRRLEQMIPLGRIAAPAEIAAAALFLISDDGSYVTGSELIVDGGVLA